MIEAPTPNELPSPATPIQHWYLNQALVEGLRNLMSDPVYQQARALVCDMVAEESCRAGQKPDVLVARDLVLLAGVRRAFAELDKLAHPPRHQYQPDEEGWGYVRAHRVPVDATETLTEPTT